MVNLVVDIGNTLTKVAVFNNRTIAEIQYIEDLDTVILQKYLQETRIDSAIISSVEREVTELEELLKSRCTYYRFTANLSKRVENRYKSPETLGLDRYAAVIGAEAIYPSKNCLVIDAGSCITYDFINKEGDYYGGSITPGIKMRFQAMHSFTERLPLVEPDPEFTAEYGIDTRSSLLSGVQNGVLNEALGFIRTYVSQYPDLKLLLCGGDVNFFDSRLKNSIFADAVKTEPNLVLIGLNEVIYQQND